MKQLKILLGLFIFLCAFMLNGCDGSEGKSGSNPPTKPSLSAASKEAMASFSINGNVGEYVNDDISSNLIIIHVPAGTDVTALKAKFAITSGTVVRVNNVMQLSGETPNDFTNSVDYVVTGSLGTVVYKVIVKPVLYVYVSNSVDTSINGTNSTISMFSLDVSSGLLEPLGQPTVDTNGSPSSVVVSPNKHYVYTPNSDSNTISIYSVNQNNGQLMTPESGPAWINSEGKGPNYMVFGNSGKFAYATNYNDNTIGMYGVDDNGEIEAGQPGQSWSTGQNPVFITFSPSGQFAYVSNTGDSTITVFGVDNNSGLLSPIEQPTTMGKPTGIAFSPSGTYLFTTNSMDDSTGLLRGYVVDSTTGHLTFFDPQYTVPTGRSPRHITFAQSGKFVYVTNSDDNTISVYAYHEDNQSGPQFNLLQVIGTGENPVQLTLAPSGEYAYVSNKVSGTISIYSVNALSGELTPLDHISAGKNPTFIAIMDPRASSH